MSRRKGREQKWRVAAKASIKTAYPAPLLSRPSLHRFVSAVGVAALRPIHSRHPTFRFALENPPFIILAFVTSDFRADRSKYFYPIVCAVRRGAIASETKETVLGWRLRYQAGPKNPHNIASGFFVSRNLRFVSSVYTVCI